MHAGIDYERYLAEKEVTHVEWRNWLEKHGSDAEKRGLMPTSEDRSMDDFEEDARQRIFMSKDDVAKAQAANPDANFSIDVVYSILTKEEFASKILNSYAKGNGAITRLPSRSRSLRTQYDFTSSIESPVQEDTRGDSIAAAKRPATAMSYTSATRRPAFVRHGTPATTPCAKEKSKKQKLVPTTKAPTRKVSTKRPYTIHTTKAPIKKTPATTKAATATKRSSVDWTKSPCISPVQNQGQCGDCWAFASASVVESAQCIAGGQKSLNKFSEQQLVSCNTQNYGCNGGAPQYAFDYILKNGFCMEASYKYTSGEGSVPRCYSCTKTTPGIKGYNVLDVGDEAGLIKAINQRPTVVTVAAGNEAWKQYTGGVLSSCDTTDLDHLVVAVGYDATSLKIRNSWGENWGEEGYIHLKRTGSGSGSGTCSVMEQMVPLEM
ncbi:Mexicain [Phytophthora ramorum]|uniref:Mexicain n=1 Tax=Phytophthora ramorum TaxID=164328 RepID=UPI0030B02427|nr:Mexicain [Phytophthora ramorum]